MLNLAFHIRESGCQTHAVACGSGTGVFLLIRVSIMVPRRPGQYICFLYLVCYFLWPLFSTEEIVNFFFLLIENNYSVAKICTTGSLAITLLGCFWWRGKLVFAIWNNFQIGFRLLNYFHSSFIWLWSSFLKMINAYKNGDTFIDLWRLLLLFVCIQWYKCMSPYFLC